MLTIRKLRVATGDAAAASRIADYVLARSDSPHAFSTAMSPSSADALEGDAIPNSIWAGTPLMLETLAVANSTEVQPDQLASALQGCRTDDGKRIRKEGMIELPLLDARGRALRDARGWARKVKVKGTKTVDLTFSAPKSVSVTWSQANPDLRAAIERSMLTAAGAMVHDLTTTKPVISHRREMQPGVGFVAALALHATARTAVGDIMPAPQLHVHAVLLGVERRDGFFASPELSGLFKHGAPLEGGALARASLAEQLVDLGFAIDSETGQRQRFFEIRGVPDDLITRMSPRTKDVVAKVTERETVREKPLSGRERAVAAMQTRAPKHAALSAAETELAWRAQAAEFDFGADAVDALRSNACSFRYRRDSAKALVGASAQRRIPSGSGASVATSRAAVLEAAAGRLRLGEAMQLLDEMESAGLIGRTA